MVDLDPLNVRFVLDLWRYVHFLFLRDALFDVLRVLLDRPDVAVTARVDLHVRSVVADLDVLRVLVAALRLDAHVLDLFDLHLMAPVRVR